MDGLLKDVYVGGIIGQASNQNAFADAIKRRKRKQTENE